MNQSQLLLDISTHALLHIEFKRLNKHLTSTEVNNLLTQYLKRVVKSNRYKAVRKTTKGWLLLGRRADSNFEFILTENRNRLLRSCSTDLYRFVALIGEIETQLSTKVQYSKAHDIDLQDRYGNVLVCVIDEDLKSSFDEQGLMTKPTNVLFIGHSDSKSSFSALIEDSEFFQSVIAYEDESHLRVELFRM